jgi:hemolysin III
MATYSESFEIAFPKQSYAEEFANTLTHGLGTIFAAAGSLALLALAFHHGARADQLVALVVYGVALTAVYAASTLSHAFQEPRRKQFFRILDQAVIYWLIAGTYTPFILKYVPAERKWWLLGAVWGLALLGFFSKALLKHRVEVVGVFNYILLGWLPAAAMVGLMSFDCVMWMLVGGLLYTVGALFLTLDQRVPFFHATWHAFVLAASGFHFYAVMRFAVI